MLRFTTPCAARSAVAFFNMKHFQVKQKLLLSPENVHEVFSSRLHGHDRLLRQSRVGSGSTRLLVVDRKQCVKGVYYPMLCLPHPVTINSTNVLGLTIDEFMQAAKGGAKAIQPTVGVVVAHPHGVAIGVFGADGSMRLPVKNFSTDTANAEEAATSHAHVGMATKLIEYMNQYFDEHFTHTLTMYFVARDPQVSLSLQMLQAMERGEDSHLEGLPTPQLRFNDKRWISLTDLILQQQRPDAPLYARDPISRNKIVSPSGLLQAITMGRLDLDTRKGEAVAETVPVEQAEK